MNTPPTTPPNFTPEKAQAFLDDLAAVFAKHGAYVDYDGKITAMEPDFHYVAIDSGMDITFSEYDVRTDDTEWFSDDPPLAVSRIAQTAHARLADAARIASIHKEVAA